MSWWACFGYQLFPGRVKNPLIESALLSLESSHPVESLDSRVRRWMEESESINCVCFRGNGGRSIRSFTCMLHLASDDCPDTINLSRLEWIPKRASESDSYGSDL